MLDHFHIIQIMCVVWSLKTAQELYVTPVVAIAMEEPLQLVDSLADHPVRNEFKVNQVSFSYELTNALHIILLHYTLCCILATQSKDVNMCIYCNIGVCILYC